MLSHALAPHRSPACGAVARASTLGARSPGVLGPVSVGCQTHCEAIDRDHDLAQLVADPAPAGASCLGSRCGRLRGDLAGISTATGTHLRCCRCHRCTDIAFRANHRERREVEGGNAPWASFGPSWPSSASLSSSLGFSDGLAMRSTSQPNPSGSACPWRPTPRTGTIRRGTSLPATVFMDLHTGARAARAPRVRCGFGIDLADRFTQWLEPKRVSNGTRRRADRFRPTLSQEAREGEPPC